MQLLGVASISELNRSHVTLPTVVP
jgi:hypothetical protein